MNAVSAIATAVAAIASMIAVIISIVQQIQIRKYEDAKTKSEQILVWYNDVVLRDIVDRINRSIDSTEKDIKNCKTVGNDQLESVLKEAFNNLNVEFQILENRIYILKIFDNKLHRDCNNKIQEIWDYYSDFINESVEKKNVAYYNRHKIQQYRVELIKMMYEQGLKLIGKWN